MKLKKEFSNPTIVETDSGVFTFAVRSFSTRDFTEKDRLYLVEKGREFLKEKLGYVPPNYKDWEKSRV